MSISDFPVARKSKTKKTGSPKPSTDSPLELRDPQISEESAFSVRPLFAEGQPAAWVKYCVSAAILLHLPAVLLALGSNLAPSYLQGEMLRLLAPYLNTTSQSYGAASLELTHAEPFDFPLSIELQAADGAWHSMPIFAQGSSDGRTPWARSRWSNFARMLIAQDQPQSELMSELASQFVRHAEHRDRGKEIVAVRFIQPHVPSFDEDALIAAGQETLIASELEPDVVFLAHVVRTETGEIAMVPQQSPERTSKTTVDRDEVAP